MEKIRFLIGFQGYSFGRIFKISSNRYIILMRIEMSVLRTV